RAASSLAPSSARRWLACRPRSIALGNARRTTGGWGVWAHARSTSTNPARAPHDMTTRAIALGFISPLHVMSDPCDEHVFERGRHTPHTFRLDRCLAQSRKQMIRIAQRRFWIQPDVRALAKQLPI